MSLLESEHIRLRALEPEDVDILYQWENDTQVWGVSNTLLPFSRHVLRKFIAEQIHEIYRTRQSRFVIETREERNPVGVIDLFDFDPHHLRAGVGVLVYASENRRKYYATEALDTLIRYGFELLHLHQLYAQIPSTNTPSIRLFEQAGFVRCGEKKDWLRLQNEWVDEYDYQLICP